MLFSIKEGVVDLIFKAKIAVPDEAVGVFDESSQSFLPSSSSPLKARRKLPPEQRSPSPETSKHPSPVKSQGKKVGRNEPCPCGSGKKYKKCCGR